MLSSPVSSGKSELHTTLAKYYFSGLINVHPAQEVRNTRDVTSLTFLLSMSRWDDPDPRVKWALDEFDYGETEPSTFIGYHSYSVAGAVFFGSLMPVSNLFFRRPLYSGLPVTAAMTVLGVMVGRWGRNYRAERHAEELAVIKHYIMTHPEKFPEPERKKFGDRVVFLPWRCAR